LPRTILVVDNNAFYRQVLGDFFRAEGFEVAVAGDGVEALERIMAGGVDLVLLDLIMPRIDGARLCRFMKSQPEFSSIPVIILSGILADEIDGIESINADAYVAKMPMDQLQVMLRRVLAQIDARKDASTPAPVLEGFEKMFRREVVLELLEERRSHDAILDAITEGIVELSEDRRILKANAVFERMVSQSASDLIACRVGDLFPDARPAIDALFESVKERSGQAASGIVTRRGRSIRMRLHSFHGGPLKGTTFDPTLARAAAENPKVRLLQSEKLPGFILLIEDVTEQLRAQEDRDRFRERMARSERMSAFGIFVGGAAHELNNPLTAVLGYSQLIETRELPEDVRAHLRKIEAGASRCKAIVESLLVFSRRGRPATKPGNLNGVVAEVVRECGQTAKDSGVTVRSDPAAGPMPAEMNAEEIAQALEAILDNAIRAASAGAELHEVRVRTLQEDGFLAVEIEDSGPGIPPETVGRIFDPFFGTREVGQGRGLGLSVAYGIVRVHGGSLSARNLPGGGACLTVRIPSTAPADASSAIDTERVPVAGGLRPARILIVDDEPVVLDLLSDFLGATYHVETARNGRDGLSKASKAEYDLILLDIKMPDMTGNQMYEALTTVRPLMAERVVFTTGDIVQEETRRFLDRVGNPYLSKPFSLDALTEMVDRILAASRAS